MATYLLTGGCGFIGSHLADALIAAGHRVRILDDLSTGTTGNVPPTAEIIQGDVADVPLVRRCMAEVDGCFHLAAVASVERANHDWLGTHRVNLTGTIAVFDAARCRGGHITPVVYASSAAVYGDNANVPLSEALQVRPLSAYGADKFGCELHAKVAGQVHGIATCGLRFFNVYGPRQDPRSPYSGVISIFCEHLRTGRGVTIFGDGHQARDFIFVNDVVRALRAAMAAASQEAPVYNVCTGRASTILNVVETVSELVGRPAAVTHRPERPGDIRASLGDPTRATRDLGFTATTDLRTGLTVTLASL